MLKVLYAIFLGLLLAVFVGEGIATFYPAPQPPEFPTPTTIQQETKPTPADLKTEQDFQNQTKQFEKNLSNYNRNVSLLALAASIVFLVVALLFETRITLLADSLLLSSIFILMYSVGRSFSTEDLKYRFLVATGAVVIALLMGYQKFIRPPKKA